MWEGKRVALLGLGKSNLAVGRYLVRNGACVTGFDQKSEAQLGPRALEASRLGISLVTGPSYLDGLSGFDTVFIAPGIKKSLPQIKRVIAEGAEISSEINLVFKLCRAPIVGITGSAGKTTTTSLVGAILRQDSQRRVLVGGNIGNPLIEVIESVPKESLVVLELSSFQLQLLEQSPQVGVLLNISENHLDVHDSMEEYVESKKNVFRYQDGESWAVLNADDPVTRAMAGSVPGNLASFSRTVPVETGAFLKGDRILFRNNGVVSDCGSISDRLIPGAHNVENILAATTASMLVGADPAHVALAVRTFPGVEHRLELVRAFNGVRYYNDSIATAPDRTIAALSTVEGPVVLIAGGYDKGIGFALLAHHIARKVRALVLIGATSGLIASEVRRAIGESDAAGECASLSASDIFVVDSFDSAVMMASGLAMPGDAVLLSPACASFDLFTNFEERGDAYKRLVATIQ